MRQQRTLSKRAFGLALKRTTLGERAARMASAVLVNGTSPTEVAKQHNVTRSAVSQHVRTIWNAHIEASELPENFRRITVILPEDKAQIVLSWERDEKIKLMQL